MWWLSQLAANWFLLLQGAGIIGGLLFTGIALRQDAKARRVGNLITLTEQHRQIWQQLHQRPELARVLDPRASPTQNAVTIDEERFVILLILHLNAAYHAVRGGVAVDLQGLHADIATFFSLPIPRAVWKKMRALQNRDFVAFVENALPNN